MSPDVGAGTGFLSAANSLLLAESSYHVSWLLMRGQDTVAGKRGRQLPRQGHWMARDGSAHLPGGHRRQPGQVWLLAHPQSGSRVSTLGQLVGPVPLTLAPRISSVYLLNWGR